MIYLHVLSSGSSGNCYIIETENRYVVVDVGLPLYRLKDFITFEKYKAIDLFITHEHTDHIGGIKPFLNKFKPNVYTSEGTAWQLNIKGINCEGFYILDARKVYDLKDYEVLPFNITHDGAQPFGYRFNFDNTSVAFATDLGVVTNEVLNGINGAHCLVLESNYEEDMLINGSYPYHLKKRVMSSKGHLSNKDAINVVSEIFNNGLKQLYFGHISEENNDYSLMQKYVDFCRRNFGISADFFRQMSPVKGIRLYA
ncbi:MAG: hypothetical protein PWQ25_369 [Deferribacteres bacterium]|jgi:phosphoribosyl 1,2-cyclic phosphodiesterase|nr:hypothetical protein [Deferribacteres bacterium]